MNNPNETQVAGSHYKANIQHWDYVVGALENRYLEGNITKYVCRHRKKNGIQDLEKALHYTDKLAEMFDRGEVGPVEPNYFDVHAFCVVNGLNHFEALICKRLAVWQSKFDLELVKANIHKLLAAAHADNDRAQAIKAGAIPGFRSPPTPLGNEVALFSEQPGQVGVSGRRFSDAPGPVDGEPGRGYIDQD